MKQSPARTNVDTSEKKKWQCVPGIGFVVGVIFCFVLKKSGAEGLRPQYFVKGEEARGKCAILKAQCVSHPCVRQHSALGRKGRFKMLQETRQDTHVELLSCYRSTCYASTCYVHCASIIPAAACRRQHTATD